MSSPTVLLVGADSAIARALAPRLVERGVETLRWSRQEGHDAQVDIFSADTLPDLPERLEGLVYFPGTITLTPFPRTSLDTFRRDWEINVGGLVRVLQHALPALQKAERASVVTISSVAASNGLAFHASIAQAKAGVEALTRSLAAEFAPRGIRFNAVAPSLTDTPLATRLLDSDAKRERMEERNPLGRIGRPEDVAATIDHLLGDDAGWMTGQVIGVDGGFGTLR